MTGSLVELRAEALERVGRRLAEMPLEVVERAMADNQWFTRTDIERAVEVLRSQLAMGVRSWLRRYDELLQRFKKREQLVVGIVMAGNIPLVGFHDMLCAAAAGFHTLYKPSSKDTALMDFAAEAFRAEGFAVEKWSTPPPDALIATGGDNARRLFESRWAGVPMLLRGNRSSAAVLTGEETCAQLRALAADIFSYSGLGCRSVSHLLLPKGYDVHALAAVLSEYGAASGRGVQGGGGAPSEGYRSNFRQRRATLTMQGVDFASGDFFVLRQGEEFSENLSEITYSFTPAHRWLADRTEQVQCVVGKGYIDFGQAQNPALDDYADGIDTMSFLLNRG